MIEFKDVCKAFKKNVVLDHISFTVEDGQFVTLIGGSGCGKTTTLKMINRLIKPTSGDIFIDGKNIAQEDIIHLRRNMGYVIQQTGLFPHMTVRENIELISRLEKRDPDQVKARTLEMMELVEIDPGKYLDAYPNELSGGQQQRVGVARAFATDPEVVLMDEPFSALDPVTRSQIQDELLLLQQKLKKTIVFVTHDMDEAIKLADKICIMNEGHIVQYDTPEQILKNPGNGFVRNFVGEKRIWMSPEFIKARDIMIDNPVCCRKDLSLVKCIQQMSYRKVDSLLVVDDGKRLLGVVRADRALSQKDKHLTAGDVMYTDFPHVEPDHSIVDLLAVVEARHTSNLPIVDGGGNLVGLITKSTLVTTLSRQFLDSEKEVG